MALTDTVLRSAKPKSDQYKLHDTGGLFVIVKPSGSKLWRLKYRFLGKEQQLSLGRYPEVSLKDARERRDRARALLSQGKNPSTEKKLAVSQARAATANTFKAIADELYEKNEQEGRAIATLAKTRWLLSLLDADLGKRPVAEIKPLELLAALKKIERKGQHDSANRLRSYAGRVFRYAIVTGRATQNPASELQGSLVIPKVRHRAAILEPAQIGALLRAIDGFEGQPCTKLALQLAPHVYVRPGELRHAEWVEISIHECKWTIPGHKTKMGRDHIVPLSRQSLTILQDIKRLTGAGRYLFPCLRSTQKPMSENTLNAALRRLGYSKDEMTTHGFRSIASTLLNESGKFSADAIERSLAHKDPDSVRAAYHRGSHWAERVTMAQWWSDHLDALKQGSKVLPFRQLAGE